MTYEEKLQKIVSKLKDERELTRIGHKTTVTLNDKSFSKVRISDICKILLKLQDDEKVLTIREAYRLDIFDAHKIACNSNYDEAEVVVAELNDGFDHWYANYQIKQKGKIENLSQSNFEEIYSLLVQIEDQLQLSQSGSFHLHFVNSIHDVEGYGFEDIDDLTNNYAERLNYLQKIGVVKEHSQGVRSLGADITLDVTRYLEIKEIAERVKQTIDEASGASQKETVQTDNKVLLHYDPDKGLLNLNGQIVKLNKDSFRAKLLELLLQDDKNRKKEWSWDEVIEKVQGTDDLDTLKENKKKFYPACDGVSKFIALKIGVNDLLIYTKSTVKINSKYL